MHNRFSQSPSIYAYAFLTPRSAHIPVSATLNSRRCPSHRFVSPHSHAHVAYTLYPYLHFHASLNISSWLFQLARHPFVA
ncbi:hypothetical protein BD414DRAFT_183964 [Trametes punicea]|nr:hypothetical protein BD414DRAFT_183964 [Trametes punicea]